MNHSELVEFKFKAFDMLKEKTVRQIMKIPQFGGKGRRARTLYHALHHNENITCFDDLVDRRNNTQIGQRRQWTILAYLKTEYDEANPVEQNVPEQNVPEQNVESEDVQILRLELELMREKNRERELEIEHTKVTLRKEEIALRKAEIVLERQRLKLESGRVWEEGYTVGNSRGLAQLH